MDLHFARLNQLAFGYWHAQTLFTLTQAGVFDTLHGRGGGTAGEVAAACGLDPDSGTALLDAGVALGLLRKLDGGRYDNSEMSQALLVSATPASLVHWVRVMGRWVAPWASLGRALQAGHAVEPQSPRIAADPAYLEEFILGMHEYASRTSEQVAAAVELEQPRILLDVGAGAGTYSIALCRKYPQLRSTLLDMEEVLPVARRIVESSGLDERIAARRTDYRSSSFGAGEADAVLLSNVLHQESRDVGLDMLRRALAALKPGGKVIVHGHFLDESRTAPVFATLHNLSARTLWEGGHSYTTHEMVDLLAQAGFEAPAAVAVAASSTKLVMGRRPTGRDHAATSASPLANETP
ncbi:MAG: methyltransferase domain-containing protein [Ramlibacter sp.]|nr:methyltransferase domain-containing protein [Ramlibacter sp.]